MATPSYAPELTGVGRYAGELARGLVARGYQVEVVTTPPHYPGWYVRAPYRATRYCTEMLDGVRVYRCPIFIPKRASGLYRLLSTLSFGLSASPLLLWRILRTRPDVVLCVEPTLALAPAALTAARLAGAATALHVQDIELDAALSVGHLNLPKPVLKAAFGLDRFIRRRFDRLITISTTMAQTLVRKGVAADRVDILRNWVNTDQIRPLDGPNPYRAELGIAADERVCLYSGQIGRKQALDLVLEAAEALVGDRRFRFVIAGDGPELPALKQRFGHLPNVLFLPLQPEERLCEFLNLADVHVLPQHAGVSELVLPSKLGGMLASGRPILVTADTESELAQFLGDAAVIVPPGDAARVVDGLLEMTHRPDTGKDQRVALARSISAVASLDAFDRSLRALRAPPATGKVALPRSDA
jgi:colanic acid biosynthesis glycosyl transferase WcaI